MKNIDSYSHVRGESLFVDDIILWKDTLVGLVFDASIAHGKIKQVNYSKAKSLEGVVQIFTYKDIVGENQIGGIIPDEKLWAEDKVHFIGQPIAFIVAESEAIAKKARLLIDIEYEELPVITAVKQAMQNESFISPNRSFKMGDVEKSFTNCDYIFEGETFTNGQEHLYLETQGCYAIPKENGNIKIVSSTQGPTAVQKIIAQVLGCSMHKIEVDVIRLGGGFGGKEDQATPWAAMVAVAAQQLKKPVKYILNRHDDMRMTGKRHPYKSNFKIGLTKDFKIKAYEVQFFQNSGAAADLSTAIAERTLFLATNSYFIPNVKSTVHLCKTNLPPNTAFRGFGGPQAMFVIESAIAFAASKLGVDKRKIQEINLLKDEDEFPYGQIATQVEARSCWSLAKEKFELEKIELEIENFNIKNSNFKKGISLMPIAFGISFTNTAMNHARSLVHIYQDGSVGVSTGAVEMGQSVNTKMLQIASETLGIHSSKVKLESTNTTRVANTSPTAASSTADLNGKAVLKACNALIGRLKKLVADKLKVEIETVLFSKDSVFVNDKKTDLKWENVVELAMQKRISLSENAHYSTPIIHFDKSKEKGHPFAYHVYGCALTIVTLDCVRGNYEFDAVKIVHDFGKSMNIGIDIGQVEGALAQGIGWMTLEEIKYNNKGQLLSNTLSTYKVPDVYAVPKIVDIIPLNTEGNKMAILKSKAVGEPPLMYGIGAYFAIQNAIIAFNSKYKMKFNAPFTPEKVLMSLYANY